MPVLQRYTKHDYDQNYRLGLWSDDHLLHAMTRFAGQAPDKIAVVDGDVRVTRAQLLELVARAAQALKNNGVAHGDIVAVQFPNTLHLIVVALALLRMGAVFHPINPSYRYHDIAKIFSVSQPRFFIHAPSFKAFDYAALIADLRATGGFTFADRAIDVAAPVEAAFPAFDSVSGAGDMLDSNALYLLGSTSGSTGDPKLYMHTHNTQYNEALILNEEMGFTESDVMIALAPVTHRGAFMWGFFQALAGGITLVLQREYKPDQIMQRIDTEKVTTFFAIPTQVVDLLDACKGKPESGQSLRIVMMAGAPVQPELIVRIRENWHHCTPVTGYGSSETGFAVITRPSYTLAQLQTCGKPIRGIEVKIDRDPASVDPIGEVLMRGAFLSSGYYASQSGTDAAYDREGWFRTGDLGQFDKDGYIVVSGRVKNVIIRAGLKIQAEEVEEIILRHQNVTHAIVLGIPDERLGEKTAACIITRDRSELTVSDLQSLFEKHSVAKFKWPEKIVTMQQFPLNATGKFDRIVLKKILSQ